MPNSKKVFVGSSTEGLPVAEAIQLGLDHAAEVTIWHQGVFGLSRGTLEELVRASKNFDFAVLVLTPDDLTVHRESVNNSARDNVIFELGLFIGTLGRDRTFIIYPRDNQPRLPSDLAGVTSLTYRTRSDNNLRAAVGPACTEIKEVIRVHSAPAADMSTASTVVDSKLSTDVAASDNYADEEGEAPLDAEGESASPMQRLRDAMLGDDERGLTLQEVADLTGYAIGTVRTYMSTGRRGVLGDAIRANAVARERALAIVTERRATNLTGSPVERSHLGEQVQRLRDEMLGDPERGISVEETAHLSGYSISTVRAYLSSGRRHVLGDAIRMDEKAKTRALAIVTKRRKS